MKSPELNVGDIVRYFALSGTGGGLGNILMVITRIDTLDIPFPYKCEPLDLYRPIWNKSFAASLKYAVFTKDELQLMGNSLEQESP